MVPLETITVRGRVVRYAEWGDRASPRVLVLVHAFPVGTGMWAPQLVDFTGWRVLAPALPGFDGSDPYPEASIDAYASQVLDLLDGHGIARAVVGGLSLGGYVTFGVLRRAVERVDGVVLADTRMGADTPEVRASRERMLGLLARGGPPAVAADMRAALFGPTTHKDHPEVADRVQRMIERQPPEAIEAAIRAMLARPDSSALLASLHLPALIIVGEDDAMTPVAEAERMQAAIRGSALVRIPRAGHMSNLENPGAFNEALGAFLRAG